MKSYCGIVPRAGRRESYPLVQARCAVSVVDVNVHATLTQTFVSASAEPQDVAYVFPLPSDAAVCAFTAVIDNARTIRGVVKEKAAAQRDYDSAVKAGKTAALLRQHTSQVFEASLGNFKPGQTVEINIEFVSIIAHAGTLDSLRLRLPTTIAPFYGRRPASLQNTVSVGSPRFELTASFQMSGNITAITSDTHPIALQLGSLSPDLSAETFNPGTAHVSLTSDGALTSDIVLELRCDGLDRPRCAVQRLVAPTDAGEATDALALTLVPRFAPAPAPAQEYLFLIDRSESMDGARLRAVRAALHIMLRSLPTEGSTFNVFSFGSRCTALWPAAVPYCTETVGEAARHVERMRADYGGTEIADALKKVMQSRKNAMKDPAALFVVTDGEAWDANAVFKVVADAVAASEKALRVFVLGVGDQVSTEMCDGIARAGHGVATYVREQENPDIKLVGLLKAARSPLVEDITVDWGVPPQPEPEPDAAFELVDAMDEDTAEPVSLYTDAVAPASAPQQLGPEDMDIALPPPPALQQAPTHLAAMYPGFRHSVFALIRRSAGAPLPTSVAVRGTMRGAPVVLDVPVVPAPAVDRTPFLHVLAARALIQSLEDNGAVLGKARIVQLGTAYGVASAHTSFVAVDEAGEPVSRPEGGFKSAPSEELSSESDEDEDGAPTRRALRTRRRGRVAHGIGDFVSDGDTDEDMDAAPAPAPAGGMTLSAIAQAQAFDGSFAALDALNLTVPAPPGLPSDNPAVWNTVIVLAVLQSRFGAPDEREVWSFIGTKARDFVLNALIAQAIEHAAAERLLEEWIACAVAQLSSP